MYNVDYTVRRRVLVKRLEVLVQSFLWSDKVCTCFFVNFAYLGLAQLCPNRREASGLPSLAHAGSPAE